MEAFTRRAFLKTGAASIAVVPAVLARRAPRKKMRVALVGTGVRGTSMWGRDLVRDYADEIEFVGLCDINPGRVAYAKELTGVECPAFTDFEEMVRRTSPDTVIVTTVDSTHHQYIIQGDLYG